MHAMSRSFPIGIAGIISFYLLRLSHIFRFIYSLQFPNTRSPVSCSIEFWCQNYYELKTLSPSVINDVCCFINNHIIESRQTKNLCFKLACGSAQDPFLMEINLIKSSRRHDSFPWYNPSNVTWYHNSIYQITIK
jgi:hypothetical protein